MIIVSLNGGLGNQLFQYAFGRKVSIQNKRKLFLETGIYKNDYLGRTLGIHNLNIKGKIVDNVFVKKTISSNTRLNILFKNLNLLQTRIENDFSYKPELLVANKWLNFYSGFWQSYKYFEDIRKTLLKELVVSTNRLEQMKRVLNIDGSTISIHVRRSDYLNDDRYGFVGAEYYSKAVKIIDKETKASNFLVFSDDVEWCEEHLKLVGKVTFISKKFELTDWEELMLMTQCSNHIIANSSFSWWGAWLCSHPGQIVIRPLQPFKDPSLLYEYYYPANWIAVA